MSEPGTTSPSPLFSVLIATYNHAAFILEALESVAAQTDRAFDLVVVDDGSTDGSAALLTAWLDRFRQAHPYPVHLRTMANGGQSAALEHGFRLCSGRYICLLDSDDRWRHDKLEAVRAVIQAHPEAGMIVHPLAVIDREGRPTGTRRPRTARLSEGDLRAEMRRTGRHVAPPTSGVVIRADVFARLLPMPTRGFTFGADAYLTFGASLQAPVRVASQALGDYRLHAAGQYLQRMLTRDGLQRTIQSQRAILEHFDLAEASRRNSFFARNHFALAKLGGTRLESWRTFRGLAAATALDSSFGPVQRLLLLGFWTLCLVAPRAGFEALWRKFQLKQVGLEALPEPGAPPASPMAPRP